MKASELIKKLQDYVAKNGDHEVAAIDIEGGLSPMEIYLFFDSATKDIGIEASVFNEHQTVFGHEGEWSDEEWEEKKEDMVSF